MTTISVEQDPTPLVRAIATDLAARLEDPAFAADTARLRGVASVRAQSTPQSVTLRVEDGSVALAHGLAGDAEVVAGVDLDGERRPPRLEDEGSNPDLAAWLAVLLEPPLPRWEEAAERFWSALSRMPGAPDALLVVDVEDGVERRFGSAGSACEIHGAPDALVTVFTGRVSLMEAAYEGTVYVRGRFPDLSVLSGAGFAIRYGGGDFDG